MKQDFPLVTIIVITYKSADYVIDTLESISQQTYKNIELIISDDRSPDNTLEICESWIEKHKNRFSNTIVTKTDRNGGICYNYNNGLKMATGKWIKYIAGDDELMPDCISSFVERASTSDDKIFISGTIPFNEDGDLPPRYPNRSIFEGDAYQQESRLLKVGTVIEGPTLFLETDTLRKLNGFDENYPFIEDYPLYMKYLANGHRINLIEMPLIHYREHFDSVSRSDDRFSDSIIRAIEDFSYDAYMRRKDYLRAYHWWCNRKIREFSKDKDLFSKIKGYGLRLTDIANLFDKVDKQ